VSENRDTRRFVGIGCSLKEEPVGADERVAMTEHERVADRPEQHAADGGIQDTFHQDVYRLFGAGEAGLQHDESGLHAEDEEGGDQRPRGVDGVHHRRLMRSVGLSRMSGREQAGAKGN